MKKLKILCFPLTGDANLSNLYRDIIDKPNISLYDFKLLSVFYRRYHVFHLHWPDYFIVKSLSFTLLRLFYFFLLISILRINNTKIIWSVHNLMPHSNHHPILYKYMMLFFTRVLDGYIVMSDYSKLKVLSLYPYLINKNSSLIYHGLYDNYPNSFSPSYCKDYLSIPPNKKVLLFFGRMERYKNISLLVDQFQKNNTSNYILVLAGKFSDLVYENEVTSLITSNSIIKRFDFIDENEVQLFFNACDLVILPFSDIHNSGSVMLSLTFKKPVYCPNKGSIPELNSLLDSNCIYTYESFNFADIQKIVSNPSLGCQYSCDLLDNRTLSSKLVSFYNNLI